jgi:hypothetical protein
MIEYRQKQILGDGALGETGMVGWIVVWHPMQGRRRTNEKDRNGFCCVVDGRVFLLVARGFHLDNPWSTKWITETLS